MYVPYERPFVVISPQCIHHQPTALVHSFHTSSSFFAFDSFAFAMKVQIVTFPHIIAQNAHGCHRRTHVMLPLMVMK